MLYLKGQSLENGIPCIFQAMGNILLQNVPAGMEQQSTMFRVKGIDPKWSQVCSLSNFHFSFSRQTCFSSLFSDVCVCVCLSTHIYTLLHLQTHVTIYLDVNSPLVCYQIFALITALYLLGHKCDHFSGAIVLKGPYFRLTKIKSPRVFLKGFADHSNEQLSIMNYSSRMRSRKSREEDKSTVHTLLHVVPSLPM